MTSFVFSITTYLSIIILFSWLCVLLICMSDICKEKRGGEENLNIKLGLEGLRNDNNSSLYHCKHTQQHICARLQIIRQPETNG